MNRVKYLSLLSIFFLVGCDVFVRWQSDCADNPIEEWTEEQLKEYTDYDVDLTPLSGIETQKDLLK